MTRRYTLSVVIHATQTPGRQKPNLHRIPEGRHIHGSTILPKGPCAVGGYRWRRW